VIAKHSPEDTSSFFLIIWSLVNFTRWWASMQVLHSHSPHSTQNPTALALSSQLVHTCKGKQSITVIFLESINMYRIKTSMWIPASRRVPHLFGLLIGAARRFWRVFHKVVIHQIYLSAFLAAYWTSDYTNCNRKSFPVLRKKNVKTNMLRIKRWQEWTQNPQAAHFTW